MATKMRQINQPAVRQRALPWLATSVGILALLLLALMATIGSPNGRPAAPVPTASGGDIASPAMVATNAAIPGVGSIPTLLSPADGTRPASLDTPVTFAWQPVSDPSASYNLEFQYSHDGNIWFKPEIVYGIIGTSYQRRNLFLEYNYARWCVWATTYSGDSERSEWRLMPLPPQPPSGG
jgi:hypothetical protein